MKGSVECGFAKGAVAGEGKRPENMGGLEPRINRKGQDEIEGEKSSYLAHIRPAIPF